MDLLEISFVFTIIGVIAESSAQDRTFDRNFRRQQNERRTRLTNSNQGLENQRPPEIIVQGQQNGQTDTQIDVIPIDQGPFGQMSFDRQRGVPPTSPDILAGSKGDTRNGGRIEIPTAHQFDSQIRARDREQGRKTNTGSETVDMGRRQGVGFGPEPRRGGFATGQLMTTNQGSFDVGGSMNLGLDVQLEGPAQILDPSGSGSSDTARSADTRTQTDRFSRLPPPRQVNSAQNQGKSQTERGLFDRGFNSSAKGLSNSQKEFGGSSRGIWQKERLHSVPDSRFDSSGNRPLNTREGNALRNNLFDATLSTQAVQEQSKDFRQGNSPRDGHIDTTDPRRLERTFHDQGRSGGRHPSSQNGGGFGPSRQENIGTFRQGQVDRQAERRTDQAGQGLLDTSPSRNFQPGKRFSQGQMEASNRAHLDAGGQGEILIEGEIQVPTHLLKNAQKRLGVSADDSQMIADRPSLGTKVLTRPGNSEPQRGLGIAGQSDLYDFQDGMLNPQGSFGTQRKNQANIDSSGQGNSQQSRLDRERDRSQQPRSTWGPLIHTPGNDGLVQRQQNRKGDSQRAGFDPSGKGNIGGTPEEANSGSQQYDSLRDIRGNISEQGGVDTLKQGHMDTNSQFDRKSGLRRGGKGVQKGPIKDPLAALLCKLHDHQNYKTRKGTL